MDESGASQQSHDISPDDISIPNDISNGKKPGGKYRQGYLPHRNDYLVPKLPASLGGVGEKIFIRQLIYCYLQLTLTISLGDDTNDPIFRDHVKNLRGTMFYVCQGSCLCGTVNNRGKVSNNPDCRDQKQSKQSSPRLSIATATWFLATVNYLLKVEIPPIQLQAKIYL